MDVLSFKAAALMYSPWLVGLRMSDQREDHPYSIASIMTEPSFLLDMQFRFSYIQPTESKVSYFDLVSATPS
jgi:hypothetical protein